MKETIYKLKYIDELSNNNDYKYQIKSYKYNKNIEENEQIPLRGHTSPISRFWHVTYIVICVVRF